MGPNIDVVGYLVAALVFSVGFLSTRRHSTSEASQRLMAETSFRIRELLVRGDRFSPEDVAAATASTAALDDPVARFSRAVNLLLLIIITVVFIDALIPFSRAEESPRHGFVLILGLFMASVAVAALGEYDHHRVGEEGAASRSNTELGQLIRLTTNVEAHRYTEALEQVNAMRLAFPSWALLTELDAYVDVQAGRFRLGLDKLQKVIRGKVHLYNTATIAAAAAIEMDEPQTCFDVIDQLQDLGDTDRNLERFRYAAGLSAAHLDALCDAVSVRNPTSPPNQPASTLKPRAPLRFGESNFPRLAGVLAALDNWNEMGPLDLSRLNSQSQIVEVIYKSIVPDQPVHAVETLVASLNEISDPRTLETMGLVLLALDQPRQAVRTFEKALRERASSARLHWLSSLAYQRVGWAESARKALQRAVTLDPASILYRITSERFEIKLGLPQRVSIPSRTTLDALPNVARVEYAVIGIATSPSEDSCLRQDFVERMITRLLSQSAGTEHLAEGSET